MRASCILLSALAAGVFGLARRAEASPASRLVYARGPGAEECPDESAFRVEVSSRLGYDPFFPWAARTVSVEIEAVDGRSRARVVVVDDKGFELGAQIIDGGRAPIATTCTGLVRSAALAVSVSLDAMPSKPPKSEPEKKAAATDVEVAPPISPVLVVAAPVQNEAPPVRHRQPRRVALSIAPQLWLGYGQWPVVSVGVGGALALRYGAWELGFEGRWDAPSTVDVASDGSVQIGRATGSLVPCAHVGLVALCAVASFGGTWASGLTVADPTSASAFFAAFGGRVALDVPLGGRFRWGLLGDVVGVATPMHLIVGSDRFNSGPVAASFGTSLSMSIF